MKEGTAKGSHLIIYPDGTLYHINLKRSDGIPPNLLFVGAADRVDAIAEQFDAVTFRSRNKARPEFYIATGTYKGIPVAAFSCGIGVDNIEIVLTEFHALFEYDHVKDEWTNTPPRVTIIRIGTAGASAPATPIGALAISRYSLGLDNLGAYYPARTQDEKTARIERAFRTTPIGKINPLAYASAASPEIADAIIRAARASGENDNMILQGITTASPGFFAPEGRSIGRMNTALSFDEFLKTVQSFQAENEKIVNHEMETSILFRLANEILGYRAGAVCLIVDNLSSNAVIEKPQADERMARCIHIALEAMVTLAS